MNAAEFMTAMPEFETDDAARIVRIEYWLAQFEARFEAARFGADLERATASWTAFNLAKEIRRGAAGVAATGAAAVIEVQVGTERIKYSEAGVAAAAQNRYLEDDYGREWSELAAQAGMGAVAV